VVVYGFLDEDKSLHNTEIGETTVLGDPSDHGFLKLIGQKCEAFVATDDNSARKSQVDLLMGERKVMPTNAIHQKASIAKSATIGHGNFINAYAVLGAGVKMGQHNIINTGVILEHETTISDFVQIGCGTRVNANVTIGSKAFIGSGVTIVAGITIGEGARIGAGSVVVADVAKKETVFGNPAVAVIKK
jgi:sugar O-acyltransferase (sialic acid O-acetyltransferase NeuD family)